MKMLFVAACTLILFVGTSGCGSSDAVMVHVKLMNEYADSLEKGASQPKIDGIRDRIQRNANKLLAMPVAERRRLAEHHRDAYQRAHARLAKALEKQRGKTVGDVTIPDLTR